MRGIFKEIEPPLSAAPPQAAQAAGAPPGAYGRLTILLASAREPHSDVRMAATQPVWRDIDLPYLSQPYQICDSCQEFNFNLRNVF